jgi:peptidyl-prolyl cis-trans isomerase A (cyclophilin A)
MDILNRTRVLPAAHDRRVIGGGRVAALVAPLLLALATPVVGGGDDGAPHVRMVTSHGEIQIRLEPEQAPATVDNFLRYVDEGFYERTVFHRVIADFMIQGGGLDADLGRLDTHDPVVNESDNGLRNERGTLAMARTQDPDSATSQFFINLVDNTHLDGGDRPGYTVFARVTSGMDVVDAIAALETTTRGGHRDVPRETVRIETVERINAEQ